MEQDIEPQQNIVIFAGPNGVGKTTFSEFWLEDQDIVTAFVNADEFARQLEKVVSDNERHMQAARLMLKAMDDLTQLRRSFAFETTLASLTYEKRIKFWQEIGYHVILIYLTLPTVEACIARVKKRVKQGGHDIPEDVIRRRFTKSRYYLEQIYTPLVDEWYIYESRNDKYVLLSEGIRP